MVWVQQALAVTYSGAKQAGNPQENSNVDILSFEAG
jgi:hypothetical protein